MYGMLVLFFVAVVAVLFLFYFDFSESSDDVVDFVGEDEFYYSLLGSGGEFGDYLVLDSGGVVEYTVVGRFVGVVDGELLVRTSQRVVSVRKPVETRYVKISDPSVSILESELVEDELVRAQVSVDKSSSQMVDLVVTVVR